MRKSMWKLKSHGARILAVVLSISMTVPVYALQDTEIIKEDSTGTLLTEENDDFTGRDNPVPEEADVIENVDTDRDEIGDPEFIPGFEAPESDYEMMLADKAGYIPVSYNGLIETPEIITPVREQYGNSCWAHGISFAAEADILKNNIVPGMTNQNLDVSERVLVYTVFNSTQFKDIDPLKNCIEGGEDVRSYSGPNFYSFGGNRGQSLVMYNRWMSPVNELDKDGNPIPETSSKFLGPEGEDYIDSKYAAPNSGYILAHLKNAYFINTKDRDVIKKNIIRHGSVECGYSVGDDNMFMGSDNTSYYNYLEKDSNHAVALIGWDDNYSRYKFDYDRNHLPKNNGAWLVRNSWGTNQGEHGYNWLSYEDISLSDITALEMAPADNYDNNYYYVGMLYDPKYFNSGSSFASVFNTKEQGGSRQKLKAVGLGIGSSDTKYDIKVYKGDYNELIKNPDGDGNILESATATGMIGCAGLYTIDLDNEVELSAGEAFSVVVTLTSSSGDKVSIFGESRTDGKFNIESHPGEALVCEPGSGWNDISDPAKNGVMAVKIAINAYTDKVDSDVVDVVSVNRIGGGSVEFNSVANLITADFASTAGSGEVISDKASTKFSLGFSGSFVPDELRSSNSGVVSVASDGTLTAVGPGNAIVRFYKNNEEINHINIRVNKEIRPEWFSYAVDNSFCLPENIGISLYENVKCSGSSQWQEMPDIKSDYKQVPADAYTIIYKDNQCVTNDAKAIVIAGNGSFYYIDGTNVTITFSIPKCSTYTLAFEVDNASYDNERSMYYYTYNGKEVIPEITGLYAGFNNEKVDCTFLGYRKYDAKTKKSVGGYITPRDAGTYCAVYMIDKEVFTDGTEGYNGEYLWPFYIKGKEISDNIVEYNKTFMYTGNEIEPSVIVYKNVDGFKVYVPADEYKVNYYNNTDIFDINTYGITDKAPYFTVTARADGNYSGSVINKEPMDDKNTRFYFSIMPIDLSGKDSTGKAFTKVTLDKDVYDYTGNPVYPVVESVTYKGSKLSADDDYSISYTNNRYPGKASVIITGSGIYGGSISCEFTIKEKGTLSENVTVMLKNKKNADNNYSGKPVKPAVNVIYKGKKLKTNQYKVDYYNVENPTVTDPINVGTYGIAVSPADGSDLKFLINNDLTYKIKPASADKLKITLSINKITQGAGESDEAYLNRISAGIEAGVKSVNSGKDTVSPDEYYVNYSNNNCCGTATAVLTFNRNYTGVREVPFTIKGKPVSELRIGKIDPQEVRLDEYGNTREITPEIYVFDKKGNPVDNQKDKFDKYEIYYTDNSNVGKASALIVGRGIYEGSKLTTFKIIPRLLSKKEMTVTSGASDHIEKQVYIGKPVQIENIKVQEINGWYDSDDNKYTNITLQKGRDYTVKISGNKKPGTGKVTIKGKGSYKGSLTSSFIIDDARIKLDKPRSIDKLGNKLKVTVNKKELVSLSSNTVRESYKGDAVTPSVELEDMSDVQKAGEAGTALYEGCDYSVSYKNNTDASADLSGNHIPGRKQPQIIIKGLKPNYTGEIVIDFEIKQLELSEALIKPLWDEKDRLADTGFVGDIQYNGRPVSAVPKIYYVGNGYEHAVFKRTGVIQISNKVFKQSYLNASKIASASDKDAPTMILEPADLQNFVVSGDKGRLEYKFSIVAGDLSKARIASVPVQSFKGAAVKPKPAVTLNGIKLKEGTDFIYIYTSNTAPGLGNVSIGPVSGSKSFVLNDASPFSVFIIK